MMSSNSPIKSNDSTNIEAIAQGVSWTDTPPGENTDNTRVLQGEINVPPKVYSSIALALFSLQVSGSKGHCGLK